MSVRVAIDGFAAPVAPQFRAAHQRGLDLEWAGINDLTDRDTLAHLLRHDLVYGALPAAVEVTADGISVDGREIRSPARATRRSCPGPMSASTA
jgi:glyceraldehyde 3-phosphate dehydrogenase